MSYKLQKENNMVCSVEYTRKDNTKISIPLDPANTDYQEYLEWTKASPMNVALPADEVTE